MRTKLIYVVLLLIPVWIQGQNRGFNYKALITNNGNAIANQQVSIRFTLLEDGTTTVYEETHSPTTDSNGIVSVEVGEGSTSDDFSSLDWQNNSYFLQVEIDTGSGYSDYGTNELKAVPYSKFSEKAGGVDYGDITNLPPGIVDADFYKVDTQSPPTNNTDNIFTLGKVGIGSLDPQQLLHLKGGDPSIELQDNFSTPHIGMIRRFTNRLYIGSNDKIQMGCDGNVRSDFTINHNGDVDITKNLKVGNATSDVAAKVIAGNGNASKLQLFEQNDYGFELEYDGALDELNIWSKHFTGNEAKRTTWKKNGEVQINGKITSESSRNNADLKAFAYGNIYWVNVDGGVAMTTPNSTNNFNVYLDNTGVYQIRLYDENDEEIPFDFNNFTVVATAYTQEPVIITSHTYSDRLYFNLYNAATSNVYTGSISFVIYRK